MVRPSRTSCRRCFGLVEHNHGVGQEVQTAPIQCFSSAMSSPAASKQRRARRGAHTLTWSYESNTPLQLAPNGASGDGGRTTWNRATASLMDAKRLPHALDFRTCPVSDKCATGAGYWDLFPVRKAIALLPRSVRRCVLTQKMITDWTPTPRRVLVRGRADSGLYVSFVCIELICLRPAGELVSASVCDGAAGGDPASGQLSSPSTGGGSPPSSRGGGTSSRAWRRTRRPPTAGLFVCSRASTLGAASAAPSHLPGWAPE